MTHPKKKNTTFAPQKRENILNNFMPYEKNFINRRTVRHDDFQCTLPMV
jgi:hypothetical protein